MSGFVKLFASITESSIWTSSDKTLRVWVAMLARADAVGIVEGSVPGFAHLCRMEIPDFEKVVAELSGPDPYSRTPDNEGRRIAAIPGGWQVLNYRAYREKGQAKDGSRAPYFRKYRAEKQIVARNKRNTGNVARNTEAEAEAEVEASNLHQGSFLARTAAPPPGSGEVERFEDSKPATAKARKRNPIFDALAVAEGSNLDELTASAKGAIATAAAEIRKASPDVTPEEVARRAANYRRLMPKATLTASALSKHWSRCGSPKTPAPQPLQDGFIQ